MRSSSTLTPPVTGNPSLSEKLYAFTSTVHCKHFLYLCATSLSCIVKHLLLLANAKYGDLKVLRDLFIEYRKQEIAPIHCSHVEDGDAPIGG